MSAEVLGFNIWTKNMPQPYLEQYAEAAQDRGASLVAIVDDILPAVVFDRTPEQSTTYNEAYRTAMSGMGFARIEFVSDILPERDEDLRNVFDMSERISLNAFAALLPEKKRQVLDDLTLTELIDTCWQLHVLEQGMSYAGITRYLTGKRSTAIFRQAKHVIDGFQFDIID